MSQLVDGAGAGGAALPGPAVSEGDAGAGARQGSGAGSGSRFGVALGLAVGWLALVVVLAVTADLLPIADPLQTDPRTNAAGPSPSHWFGTDTLGRDLLARCLFGARVSLFIGLASAGLAAVFGSAIGFAAGYFRGRVEALLVSAMDAMLAFPSLVLALALTAFLGASQRNVILAITAVAIPVFGRLVRGQTLSIREREFVLASRASGASDARTLVTEIAPNVAPAIAAYAVLLAALAIVVEGSLSFLGLGVPLPTPTWGSVIASGQGELDTAPHISAFPAAFIFLTVLALNTVGDWLRDHFEAGGARP